MPKEKTILLGDVKDLEAAAPRSPSVRHPVAAGRLTVQRRLLDNAAFERGLREAALLVSQESGRRRETGEMQAYYALNTVWHMLQRRMDEAEKGK